MQYEKDRNVIYSPNEGKEQGEQQEASGEQFFEHIIQPQFKENTSTFRAISAILISGL